MFLFENYPISIIEDNRVDVNEQEGNNRERNFVVTPSRENPFRQKKGFSSVSPVGPVGVSACGRSVRRTHGTPFPKPMSLRAVSVGNSVQNRCFSMLSAIGFRELISMEKPSKRRLPMNGMQKNYTNSKRYI